MRFGQRLAGLGATLSATLLAGAVAAQDGIAQLPIVGAPHPEGIGFQPAATVTAEGASSSATSAAEATVTWTGRSWSVPPEPWKRSVTG